MSTSTGCRSMAPLNATCQATSPPEDLQPSEDDQPFAQRTKLKRSSVWYLTSWNVRSLLDTTGSIETARQRCESDAEDRKIDQVVDVLDDYHVTVAALQETKWFGKEVYKVRESLVLTAGRPVPRADRQRERGEGVALILKGPAVQAWKAGGSRWKSWGSRIISASLRVGTHCSKQLHVLSCYAPTYSSSREMKEAFYNDLQQALSEIPSHEMYVVLGDFNARVGSRIAGEHENDDDDESGQSSNVLGPHGHGELNEAGRELLSFLSINEATVCNTWYQKKGIHKATWQHPGSKKWHCIDYAIMKQSQRRKCLDVSVMRGAQCNTDHQMLRMKLNVGPVRRHCRPNTNSHMRFDISKLKEKAVDGHGRMTARGHFQEMVGEKLNQCWKETDSIEEKWTSVKSTLCEAAEATIGREKRRQADWFRESAPIIHPLLQKRNALYCKWLSSGKISDKEEFQEARKKAQKVVREAKNNWFSLKAKEAQGGVNGGKVVWKCIREMQRGRRGLVPLKTRSVRDEEGHTCSTPQQQHGRWRRHFTNLLNIVSEVDVSEIEQARQRPTRAEMADPPTSEELENAISKLRNGKAAGQSGILPEMVKAACGNVDFFDHLLELATTIWNEQQVPQDWVDAVLIPIPKKGDLCNCDNWRGIALLDVVGKVVATILQERLQVLAEQELPESQCGFRKGRSCTDMIFVVRQLMEKSWEHRAKTFFTFVDLKKAYDSVPRRGMWLALKKLGVPEKTINLVRAFTPI